MSDKHHNRFKLCIDLSVGFLYQALEEIIKAVY